MSEAPFGWGDDLPEVDPEIILETVKQVRKEMAAERREDGEQA